VLLVGDSISRNYFPEVTRDLKGVANLYLMASSICVGDPRLPAELISFAKLESRVAVPRCAIPQWHARMGPLRSGVQGGLSCLPICASPDRSGRYIDLGFDDSGKE
jgi:hypothetical protein